MRGKEASGKAREARLSLSVYLDEEAYSSGAPDVFPTDAKVLSHRMRPTLKTAEWRENTCFLDDVVESVHQPSWKLTLPLDGLSHERFHIFYDHWVRILLMAVESILTETAEAIHLMVTSHGVTAKAEMLKRLPGGFPGGAVVENLPANAGDTGSSPGLGRSHMPRSNWAREPQLLSLRVWSLCSATREAATVRGPRTAMKSGPHLPQLERKPSHRNEDPTQP